VPTRFYQSAFNPPDRDRAAPQPPGRAGWEGHNGQPTAARRRQQPQYGETPIRPAVAVVVVPQGWDAVAPVVSRRQQQRQQPDAGDVFPRVVVAVAPQGWDAVTSQRATVRARRQPDQDPTPYLSQAVAAQVTPQGWDAVAGVPTGVPRRQTPPTPDVFPFLPAPQPPGRDGWQPIAPAATRRAARPSQPATGDVFRPEAATPTPAPQGWEAVVGTPRRLVRQQPGTDEVFVRPAVVAPAAPQGWEVVAGTPRRLVRQQPTNDPTPYPFRPAPQPPGRDGWQPPTVQSVRSVRRQQPAQVEVFVRPAAVVQAPRGWEAVGAANRRNLPPRTQPGSEPVLFQPPAVAAGSEALLVWFF